MKFRHMIYLDQFRNFILFWDLCCMGNYEKVFRLLEISFISEKKNKNKIHMRLIF